MSQTKSKVIDIRTVSDVIFHLNKAKNILEASEVYDAIREDDEQSGISKTLTDMNILYIAGHCAPETRQKWKNWFAIDETNFHKEATACQQNLK